MLNNCVGVPTGRYLASGQPLFVLHSASKWTESCTSSLAARYGAGSAMAAMDSTRMSLFGQRRLRAHYAVPSFRIGCQENPQPPEKTTPFNLPLPHLGCYNH